jgi:hypothetical protein
MDLLGIATDAQARQRALGDINIGRMSPAALHRIDPVRFAKPLPRTDEMAKLQADVAKMRRQISVLRSENERLTKHASTLEARLAAPPAIPAFIPTKTIRMADVIGFFAETLKAENYVVNGRPWSLDSLVCKLRSRSYVIPRHICIWLIRMTCPQTSLLAISETLKLDHTSVLHAMKRAPAWIAEDPFWERMAKTVLDHFRGEQQ